MVIGADPAIVAEIARDCGATGREISNADSAAVKDALRTQTESAIARGIFGAPSFLVGEELFWGNDRLNEAIATAMVPAPGTV